LRPEFRLITPIVISYADGHLLKNVVGNQKIQVGEKCIITSQNDKWKKFGDV
jgi:hypothetical protein